ncbi:MAG: tryptophan 7-halogenase [Fuerstiella sp.]
MNQSTTDDPSYVPTIRFPKRVVILGSDVTAWMAATMLTHHFGRLGICVTVCPGDSNHASAFRACATSSALVGLLQNIGVDEHDMLRACRGTYRLATQFSDWVHDGRDFWQPFGTASLRVENLALFDAWLSERKAGRLLRPLHSYSPHWTASLAGKSPHSFSAPSLFAESGQYGFHLDTDDLAAWFRTTALKFGAEEISGAIQKVAPNGRGGMAQVITDGGKAVPGDLFLDCRAISSLSGKGPRKNWTSWHDCFCGDRAAQIRMAGRRPVPVFTHLTGLDNGWVRAIPLAEEIDSTYVFASDTETDDQAGQRLRTMTENGVTAGDSLRSDVEFCSIDYGRRTAFWKDNVVFLGHAACQIDAVASTQLHLIQTGIELLMELFPDRNIGRATRSEFNRRMTSIADEFRDVAQLHHVLTRTKQARSGRVGRSESAAECRGLGVSDNLQTVLDVYDACGAVEVRHAESTPVEEIRSLLAGCGRLPARPSLAVRSIDPGRIQAALRQMVTTNEALVNDLPLHEELLDWIHTGPFQQSGKQQTRPA